MTLVADLIGAVESAYSNAVDDREWLREICRRLTNAPRDCAGAHGVLFDGVDPAVVRYEMVLIDHPSPPGIGEIVRAFMRTVDAEASRRLAFGPPVFTLSEAMGPGFETSEMSVQGLHPLGLRDALSVRTADAQSRGCVVNFGLTRCMRLTAPERMRWSRVATHVAAGMRLRQKVAEAATPEAVLRPDGRVEHAEPAAQPKAAREALRTAARSVDRARSRLRREDADAALELWKGLFAGRWSLVDRFESDGRRYILARRNDPDAPGHAALSRRESQVASFAAKGHGNKLIAYELGLAVSTVANHLATACRKLGLRSRLELSAMLAQERS